MSDRNVHNRPRPWVSPPPAPPKPMPRHQLTEEFNRTKVLPHALRVLGLIEELRVKRLHPDARLPTYATEGSSGLDLYALETTWLRERSMTRVRTGVAIEIPEGYEAQVRPRSGLSCNGVHVAFGSVDRDYRGEIHVIATMLFGQHRIEAGDRLAQLVIAPVARVQVLEVEELSDTARGTGGFGSSGR